MQIFRNNLTPCKLFFYVKGMFLNAKRKGKRERKKDLKETVKREEGRKTVEERLSETEYIKWWSIEQNP